MNENSVEAGTNNPLLDFIIKTNSPAKGTGSGGKDMGLLYDAGRTNWTRSRGSNLPFIYKMTLNSVSIAPGDNVQVTVDAKSN